MIYLYYCITYKWYNSIKVSQVNNHYHQEQWQWWQAHTVGHCHTSHPLHHHRATLCIFHFTLIWWRMHWTTHTHTLNYVISLHDGTSRSTVNATATHTHNFCTSMQEVVEVPALHTYECLCQELGLALHECEWGQEPLLKLFCPPLCWVRSGT